MKIETSKRFSFRSSLLSPSSLLIFSFCLCFAVINLSCGSKPTDLRTLVPAETLVYLETNDLAAALQPIVDSKPFTEVAKRKPDFSALRGVQLAVAVTGFETSEEKLTDEHSVGRVQPHFVAVADTHAWHFQAVGFAEQKIGAFVAEMYDNEPTLEKPEKNGGRSLTWTAKDGRKAYAFVIGSIIYFGNDETAIEKCLAVKRGEADSIAKTGKVQSASQETLASGYVSTDGIAQIANIAGLKVASQTGEDSEVQSAIAGILPQLIRGSITDITWSASLTAQGIEDKYKIGMPPEIANVFNETFVSNAAADKQQTAMDGILSRIPQNGEMATRYNLKSPQVAWRSVMLVAKGNTDAVSGAVIATFGNALFAEYGISDPEMFLSSLGGTPGRSQNIVTVKRDAESEESIMLSMSGNYQLTQKSFIKEMKPDQFGEDGWSYWSTRDHEIEIRFEGGSIALGSKDEFQKMTLGHGTSIPERFRRLAESDAPISTIRNDRDSASQITEMLSAKKSDDAKAESTYFTETRFTKSGIERRTISDFGLIGSIIAQLAQE